MIINICHILCHISWNFHPYGTWLMASPAMFNQPLLHSSHMRVIVEWTTYIVSFNRIFKYIYYNSLKPLKYTELIRRTCYNSKEWYKKVLKGSNLTRSYILRWNLKTWVRVFSYTICHLMCITLFKPIALKLRIQVKLTWMSKMQINTFKQ